MYPSYNVYNMFSTLTTKRRVCVKGASKQISDPKNSTAPGPRPPVLKFLDPPLKLILFDVPPTEGGF